ncbi:MAG: hypothetical protein ACJ786_02235 [Catenulispora sp.]
MPKPRVAIPRSAKLTDTITGTNSHGATVTVTRHGPLIHGGQPTEWIVWDRTNADGTRDRWAEQVTGYRLTTLGAELDKIEAMLALTNGATRTRASDTPQELPCG